VTTDLAPEMSAGSRMLAAFSRYPRVVHAAMATPLGWRAFESFCQGDLSSLFFDIRKDSLYCDAPTALRRRAYRTVLDYVFERLTVWLSPLTSFTMEEAWTTRFPEAKPAIEVPPHMALYYMVLLKRGPKWTPEVTEETTKIQEGHMANIHKMAESGKLVLAGPFLDGGELRGIFLFKVGSAEEAKALMDSDPAVQAGRLLGEIHPWMTDARVIQTGLPPLQ
jgi:uncharacterized protein YciI